MAFIPTSNIQTGEAITAVQILNIINALNNVDTTDISIKGALSLPGFADISASLAQISGSSFTSPFTSAGISGSVLGNSSIGTTNVTGMTIGSNAQSSSIQGSKIIIGSGFNSNQPEGSVYVSKDTFFIGGNNALNVGYTSAAGSNYGNERFRVDTFSNTTQLRMRGRASDGSSLLSLTNFDTYGVLELNANQSTSPFYLINSTSEDSSIAFRGATATNQFTFYTNNTISNAVPSSANGGLIMRGNFQMNGEYAIKAGASAWQTNSDERYKENIIDADLDICYNNIKNLKLKKYKYKDEILEHPNTDTSTLGWIAQDVETIFPKSVSETPLTTWVTYKGASPIYSSNGEDIIKPGDRVQDINAGSTVIPDFKTLENSQILNSLYGAVQKLQSTTELLQTQVSSSSATILSQQTRIEALEAQINGEM